LYGGTDHRTDHPYQNGPPRATLGPGNVCTHPRPPVEVGGSMWKRSSSAQQRRRVTPPHTGRPRCPPPACLLPKPSLPGRLPLRDRWCTGPPAGPHPGNGGSRPPQPVPPSAADRCSPALQSSGVQRVVRCPARLVLCGQPDRRDIHGVQRQGALAGLKTPAEGRAGVTEARGPLGPRRPWSLWIVGRWPSPTLRFPGGAAPREPPFAGVSAGSGPPT
jgi:hypothetical protein